MFLSFLLFFFPSFFFSFFLSHRNNSLTTLVSIFKKWYVSKHLTSCSSMHLILRVYAIRDVALQKLFSSLHCKQTTKEKKTVVETTSKVLQIFPRVALRRSLRALSWSCTIKLLWCCRHRLEYLHFSSISPNWLYTIFEIRALENIFVREGYSHILVYNSVVPYHLQQMAKCENLRSWTDAIFKLPVYSFRFINLYQIIFKLLTQAGSTKKCHC